MTQIFLTKLSTVPWTVPGDVPPSNTLLATDLMGQTTDSYMNCGDTSTNTKIAQVFTASASGSLNYFVFLMNRAGSPVDNMKVEIYDGGSSFTTLLGTSTSVIGISTVIGGLQAVAFYFPTPVAVTNGNLYSAVLSRSGAVDAVNYPQVRRISTGSTYSGGSVWNYNGSTWTVIFPATPCLSFQVGIATHLVEQLGAGGNGGVGTTGTSGVGGGGGGGGGYQSLVASSSVSPGSTTISYNITTGGSATNHCWENTTNTNCYYIIGAGNGTSAGANGGRGVPAGLAGSPALTYFTSNATNGNQGASTGKNLGGGGGGGAGGPLGDGGRSGTSSGNAGTGGNGGGGSNNGTTGASTNSASSTFTAGGTGSSGAGGSSSGAAGTGSSGGAGTTATTTTGSTAGNGGSTDTTFDASHGIGGGGGGAGAATSTGTYTITGGNGAQYGSGGGGCGYGRGTATFVQGIGGDGLNIITYTPLAVQPPQIVYAGAVALNLLGPSYRFNAPILASAAPAPTVVAPPPATGSTLPMMGVG